jgi:hypothetical protein
MLTSAPLKFVTFDFFKEYFLNLESLKSAQGTR